MGLDLTALWALTLAVMSIGFAGSLLAWWRGGAAVGFGLLFACGALYPLAKLLAGSAWPLPADAHDIGEAAVFGTGLAGLVALHALARATRERDHAEYLHWDSMELVRGVHELAARPDASLEQKLARVLELGAARFALDHAIACRLGERATEILGWRAPEGGMSGDELAAALAPRLRLAAEAPRALALESAAEGVAPAALRAFLGVCVPAPGGAPCVLAFAGRRDGGARFTATDKDLIGLLAYWLCGELELRARAEPARRAAPRRPSAAPLRERRDLNHAVRRVEARLRSLVGANATLELALADRLPALVPQRIPLEVLVESLVVAASGLVRGGTLRVETAELAAQGGSSGPDAHATLTVRARGADVDADAVRRAFASAAPDAILPVRGRPLPLGQVESLLRRAGGDLSLQVEPGQGALLTAFLPGSATADTDARARVAAAP